MCQLYLIMNKNKNKNWIIEVAKILFYIFLVESKNDCSNARS